MRETRGTAQSQAPQIRLTSGAFWGGDPHAGLTWLRANDPVYWDAVGGVWGLARYHDVRSASRQPETFSSAGGIRPDAGPVPMMIDMDDPQHKQRRQLVYKGFIPRRVEGRRQRIEAISHALVDRVCERGECDFVADLAAWLPLIVIGDLIGVVPERYDDLLRWSDDLMRGQGHFDDPAAMGSMMTAFAQYAEYFALVLADRRAAPRDDLISVLIQAEVDGDRLDDDSLLHESLTRTPNDHLAFGHGTHFCLGNSLARLELEVIFSILLDRLPDITLAVPDEPPLRPAAFVSGYESLHVTFKPTAPVGATL